MVKVNSKKRSITTRCRFVEKWKLLEGSVYVLRNQFTQFLILGTQVLGWIDMLLLLRTIVG